MAIKIKNKFVEEDIINENGEKIGVIKFNPEDSTIMKTLADILDNLTIATNNLKNYEHVNLDNLDENSTYEDFEKASKDFEIVSEMLNLEYEVVKKSIDALKNVFGDECINCFTGGTMDINSLMPLLNFVAPYVKKNRNQKVNKYLKKNNDVME